MKLRASLLACMVAATITADGAAQDPTLSGPVQVNAGLQTTIFDMSELVVNGPPKVATAVFPPMGSESELTASLTKPSGNRLVLKTDVGFWIPQGGDANCIVEFSGPTIPFPLVWSSIHVPAGARFVLAMSAHHAKLAGTQPVQLSAGLWQTDPMPIQPHYITSLVGPSVQTAATRVLEGGRTYVFSSGFRLNAATLPHVEQSSGSTTHVLDRVADVAYGAACAGTQGLAPELLVSGDFVPDSILGLHLVDGAPGGQAFLAVGTQAASVAAGFGCTLLVDPAAFALLGPVPLASPAALTPGAVSFDVRLDAPVGTSGFVQAFVVPPAGGGFSATNGVAITVQ